MSIVPGRDVPEVPQAWVDAVNKSVNDANHDDLCGCRLWPDAYPYYKPGQWDIGVDLTIAVGALTPLIRAQIGAELAAARSLRLDRPSQAVDPAAHTPARVLAYLRGLGWVREGGAEIAELWRDPESGQRVTVSLHPNASDYAKTVGFLASDLATLRGTGELQILSEIAEAGDGDH